jgi:hypothetical protein
MISSLFLQNSPEMWQMVSHNVLIRKWMSCGIKEFLLQWNKTVFTSMSIVCLVNKTNISKLNNIKQSLIVFWSCISQTSKCFKIGYKSMNIVKGVFIPLIINLHSFISYHISSVGKLLGFILYTDYLTSSSELLLIFDSTGVWPQDLVLSRKILYYLKNALILFCF